MSNQRDMGDQSLPKLQGAARKQLRYAYQIRDLYAVKNPGAEILHTETQAKYWIENRSSLIGDVVLPKRLPPLSGAKNEKQVKLAFAIRAKVQSVLPESPMLRSQTDVLFWISNRRIFDFAYLGYLYAPAENAD